MPEARDRRVSKPEAFEGVAGGITDYGWAGIQIVHKRPPGLGPMSEPKEKLPPRKFKMAFSHPRTWSRESKRVGTGRIKLYGLRKAGFHSGKSHNPRHESRRQKRGLLVGGLQPVRMSGCREGIGQLDLGSIVPSKAEEINGAKDECQRRAGLDAGQTRSGETAPTEEDTGCHSRPEVVGGESGKNVRDLARDLPIADLDGSWVLGSDSVYSGRSSGHRSDHWERRMVDQNGGGVC
ncbi:hypothetical protein DFH07DRAFT_1010750 [Mycena maculata]|uniref:Uncharacterized protein n=1 Tax=Mycena maculata TaxID=230809 RepID=A0AAD7KDN5_9AGAR|nr:hypothetical protein DFH07DRAFT_1010750 [Mycena maculata]